MSDGIARIRQWPRRSARFLSHDVWQPRLSELSPGKALLYRSARILYCTFRGLAVEEKLHVRAAALTYFTVLSIVPLLAFAFALLKGFGAYDAIVQGIIRPQLVTLLAGNAPLRQAVDKLLEFVEQTGVARLGFFGLLTLLYAATRLLRYIEGALNEIWGARAARDLLRQLRDYVAIIVVMPVSLMAAVAFTTFGQALNFLRDAGKTLGISAVLDPVIGLITPLTALFLGLLFVYMVLPNATVRLRSAAVGALVGAVIWYLVLIVHFRFQVGVARYNALYSGFAAFPIFLAWLDISWLVVLVGAQIASVHQHDRSLAQRARIAEADRAFKEAVGLSAVLEVARAFVRGTPHPTREQLSARFDAPEELISELLDRLLDNGMLVRTSSPTECGYALARSPDELRVKDVLDALRRSPSFRPEDRDSAGLDPVVAQTWLELDRALEGSPANCSFRELLDKEESRADPEAQPDAYARQAESRH